MNDLSQVKNNENTSTKISTRTIVTIIAVVLFLCIVVICIEEINPIVLSIEYDKDCCFNDEGVYTFYADKHGSYYLADGALPFSVTVYYLFGDPETLTTALQKGHITLDDLNRFDIEYGIIPNNP